MLWFKNMQEKLDVFYLFYFNAVVVFGFAFL